MKKSLLLLAVLLAFVLFYALLNTHRNEVDPSPSGTESDALDYGGDSLGNKKMKTSGAKFPGPSFPK